MLSTADLHDWQLKSARTMAKRQQCALFADPGDGKTITTLTALAICKPEKTLIIAPAKVCSEGVWPAEAGRWSHTQNVSVVTLHGLAKSKREGTLKQSGRVHVISYALIPWLIDAIAPYKLHQFYQAVVFDELSNLKTSGSVRFRRLRSPIQKVPIRFGLTGSPTGNALLNLWPEMFMVAGPDPLGPRITDFRTRYFETDYSGYNWLPKEDTEAKVIERIRPYALYVPNARGTKQKDRISYRGVRHTLPKAVQRQYDELRTEYVAELAGTTVESANAAVLSSKLKQLESGAIYENVQLGEEPSGAWVDVHSERLKACEELVASLEGNQLLIFYEYQHELERLKSAFPHAVNVNDQGAINRWNNKEFQLMLAHPKSAGHGLNLHLGGAHNMLFFTAPWSWEYAEQCIGRLDRTGQQKRVNVFHFAGLPIADDVVKRWKEHSDRQKRVKAGVA